MAKVDVKEAPDLDEVNRLIKGEPGSSSVSTVDIEYALAALRSENVRLRETIKTNAERAAQAEETYQKNRAILTRENLRLGAELLTAHERIAELQNKLLDLQRILNNTAKE
jgi:predicted  nucleic acid-binding Zn-ribbon protein